MPKRPLDSAPAGKPLKKQKQQQQPTSHSSASTTTTPSTTTRNLLGQYYHTTQTLRQYLLCRLPSGPRLRRKKIAAFGLDSGGLVNDGASDTVKEVCHALDTVLVCTRETSPVPLSITQKREEWAQLSQALADESAVTISSGDRVYCQTEIVDFAIWLLFSRNKSSRPPRHLLCHGFSQRRPHASKALPTSIPGLVCEAPNHHVDVLKSRPWPEVLALLGRAGDAVMADILVEGAVFVPVEGHGNYWQLSGVPISEVQPIQDTAKSLVTPDSGKLNRSPSDIVFIRSRMMYARAALTGGGGVETGFRHIHALNRYPHVSIHNSESSDRNEKACAMLMMYIFPRQYGLHNVFDSPTDTMRTVQKLQDYTLREDEIYSKFSVDDVSKKTPKRLRGECKRLVQRLQILHGRCSYVQMLHHYCPARLDIGTKGRLPKNSSQTPSPIATNDILEAATPTAHVSAFCQAVLSKIIPDDFWGGFPETKAHNKARIMKRVDAFIKLRQFEAMSLHDVVQDLKLADIPWLAHPKLVHNRPSLSDTRKRTQLFHELVYYVFDSLLIPLVRENFYVTESNAHKYRLLYFRHDVWRHVAEPAMATIKAAMFEKINLTDAQRILAARRLGYSQIRLLPKEKGVRPVMNLKRRQLVGVGAKKRLGPSINSVLLPAHAMLKLERTRNPSLLGSSMFSVGEIYARLKAFSSSLPDPRPALYFAKVDVKAAFDTIPQTAVLRLMGNVPSGERSQYTIAKHVEVKPKDGARSGNIDSGNGGGAKRWLTTAMTDPTAPFPQRVATDLTPGKKNTIFVGGAASHTHSTLSLLTLMAEHVDTNIVKIGKRFYRQKNGVPQGSVLSSILCNYFYADLEATHLGFLVDDGCLLMRLIDDFLLVTMDKNKAARFVRTMHAGVPEYGVAVSPAKTLVNFDLEIDGRLVARVHHSGGRVMFPYCGTLINCETLAISRDQARLASTALENSLTVGFGRTPGQNFRRKVLKSFQIQSHAMFYDTQHNPPSTVLANIYNAFLETAAKMWAHARCLPIRSRPTPPLVVDTITQTISAAVGVLSSRSRREKHPGYRFAVGRGQVAWLGYHAFKEVLVKKQTAYIEVLGWLDERIGELARGERELLLPGDLI